jgi:molybdopterin adenylyltransferase
MGKPNMKTIVIGFEDRPSVCTLVGDWISSNIKTECDAVNVESSSSALIRKLNELLEDKPELIVICGRTGIARDQFVPQTIAAIADYEIPGFGEKMRRDSETYSSNAALSRGGVWLTQNTLIAAVPGKDQAAIECLSVIKDILVHATLGVKGACTSRGRKA